VRRFPRIRPYRTFAVDTDGARRRVDTYELVLERPVGVDLEINLAPHPGFRGFVAFSTFRGSALLLEAGGGNVLYLFMEDWPRGDRRRKDERRGKRTPPCHVYTVDGRGEKNPTPDRRFAVDLGGGRELEIDLAPPAPWARHVCVRTDDGPLLLELNAANVVHVSVARASARPPTSYRQSSALRIRRAPSPIQ